MPFHLTRRIVLTGIATVAVLAAGGVANFGDQFSDLEGRHADRTFKLPNPNYNLP